MGEGRERELSPPTIKSHVLKIGRGGDDNNGSNMEKRETEKRGMGGEGEKGWEETTVGGLGMSYNNQIFKRKEGGAGG